MAAVLLYHAVGDLTVAKPELNEIADSDTVESAIQAIGESSENGIPIWKRKPQNSNAIETDEMGQRGFVGILNSLQIVAFLAGDRCLEDQEKAMKTPVSEIVVLKNSLLKVVDPATRLMDALELMKQGVERLLVPRDVPWKGTLRKFAVLYNGRCLKNTKSTPNSPRAPPATSSVTSSRHRKFCILSREDVIRFLIGCLGALAPIPLTSISALEAINPHYCFIESSRPAVEAAVKKPDNPSAVAVVEPIHGYTIDLPQGYHKIIGEISACKLSKHDLLPAAYALAKLSGGRFLEYSVAATSAEDVTARSPAGDSGVARGTRHGRSRRFSSRSMGFLGNAVRPRAGSGSNQGPLTCKPTSSLAAVMAQMLSHRASHLWVTEGENDERFGRCDQLCRNTLCRDQVSPGCLNLNPLPIFGRFTYRSRLKILYEN